MIRPLMRFCQDTAAEALKGTLLQKSARCNTLQHTATHCNYHDTNALQQRPLKAHIFKSQHTATHCNTLQHTATLRNTLQHTATAKTLHCSTLQHMLQHTATHCNTLQHTATTTTLMHCSRGP